MSINLPYLKGSSEKLQHILRSHKMRSTFYIENTLHKVLCKPKDLVATDDINTSCPSVSVRCASVASLVNNFDESAFPASNYVSLANK